DQLTDYHSSDQSDALPARALGGDGVPAQIAEAQPPAHHHRATHPAAAAHLARAAHRLPAGALPRSIGRPAAEYPARRANRRYAEYGRRAPRRGPAVRRVPPGEESGRRDRRNGQPGLDAAGNGGFETQRLDRAAEVRPSKFD